MRLRPRAMLLPAAVVMTAPPGTHPASNASQASAKQTRQGAAAAGSGGGHPETTPGVSGLGTSMITMHLLRCGLGRGLGRGRGIDELALAPVLHRSVGEDHGRAVLPVQLVLAPPLQRPL